MKKEIKENFRVVIEPRRLGNLGAIIIGDRIVGNDQEISKEYESRCEEIKDQVERHIDYIGYVSVEYDSKFICSHCEYGWDVSEDDNDPEYPKGMPLCCEKAIEEWELKKKMK